jgi:phenylalanine-4-hydroxylase
LQFEAGITVEGEIITGKRNLQGKIILISFRNCTVKIREVVLFHPSWGIFDMAIGVSVVSAFSGLADPNSFGLQFEPPKEKTQTINYTTKEKELHKLYAEVRKLREKGIINIERLKVIFNDLLIKFPQDWLLPLEIYELLLIEKEDMMSSQILTHLNNLSEQESVRYLIQDGIKIINAKN